MPPLQVSWCKVELELTSPKSVLADPMHPAIAGRAAPPLTVASISLKTVINDSSRQHEVTLPGF
jgi:DNA polymerase alpha subunit A